MSLRGLRHLLLWYFFIQCLLRSCPFKSHPAHPVEAHAGSTSSCCSKTCQNVLVPNFCLSRCQHGARSLPSFHFCAEVSSDWSLCSLCFQSKLTFSFFSSFSFLIIERRLCSTSCSCHALRRHIYYLNTSNGVCFIAAGLILLLLHCITTHHFWCFLSHKVHRLILKPAASSHLQVYYLGP